MGYFKNILITKTLIGLGVFSTILFYRNSSSLERIANQKLTPEIRTEAGFFEDSPGLIVEKLINEYGNREVYLTHEPTSRKVEVMQDLSPKTETMLDTIYNRLEHMCREEVISTLRRIKDIEGIIYENYSTK